MLVGSAGSSRFHFGSVAQFCLASIFSGSADFSEDNSNTTV